MKPASFCQWVSGCLRVRYDSVSEVRVLWVLMFGCLTSGDEYASLLADAQDSDDDGFGALAYGGTDCDDTDPEVFPGAVEACDGVDNNCDGSVDSEAVDAVAWFPDLDGDGFGGSENGVLKCEQELGYSDNSLDCDDSNASISPDETEVCDGIDNDCDAAVDDADPTLDLSTATRWFPDADVDGYGDAGSEGIQSCVAPTGTLGNSMDCDDANRNVNPTRLRFAVTA